MPVPTVTPTRAGGRARAAAPMGWPWQARLLLLSAVWGSSFILIKFGDRSFVPFEVSAGRIAVGAVALVVVLVLTHDRLPSDRRLWFHLAVVGLLMNALPFTLFAWGEQRVTSVAAGIFNAATPLFVLPVALVMLPSERPTRAKMIGLAVGFLGVLTVLGAWRGVGGTHLTGDLACLMAAVSYGFGMPYTRRFVTPPDVSATSLAAAQLLCAAAEMALASPLFLRRPAHVEALSVASVVLLGVVGTGFAYILNYSIVREAGATNASLVTYLITIFSTIFGVGILSESLTWTEPVGAAVVLLGVAISQGRLGTGRPGPGRTRAGFGSVPASEVEEDAPDP